MPYFMKGLRILTGIMIFSCIASCAVDKVKEDNTSLNIRISSDADRLNPLLTNSPVSREVNNLIFLTCADFDPESYELTPVLIEAISEGTAITDGPLAGGRRFDLKFRQKASWDDGSPITAEDYLFTLKIVKNPSVNAAIWRGYLEHVVRVDIDPVDRKKFSVFMDEEYMLAKEVVTGFDIFPKHIYDPDNLMNSISLELLNNVDSTAAFMEKDSSLQKFAAVFNSNTFSREVVEGAGPYKLASWEADQYIKLIRKENWWGEHMHAPNLYNEPKEIIFRIVKDDQTAINLLHDGGLDIMSSITALSFEDLKKDSLISAQYNFFTPSLPRYYYLGLNNRNPELVDKQVRKAMAHVINVDAIIENLEGGYGNRTTGIISPSAPFYNKDLPLIDYNIEKAKDILKQDGWGDQDNDGILDKTFDQNFVELELDMVVSGSQLGQQIALLFQQSAREIGVQVNIDTRDQAGIRNAVNNRDFDVIALVAGQAITPPDPYQSWHTDNDKPGAGNRFGFGNAESDSLILAIREELDDNKRNELYKQFQKVLYEEQPVIFLYNPQERIIVNKDLEGIISSKRPGYFPGSFKKVQN